MATRQMRAKSSWGDLVQTIDWFTWLRKLYSRVRVFTRCSLSLRSVMSQLMSTTRSSSVGRAWARASNQCGLPLMVRQYSVWVTSRVARVRKMMLSRRWLASAGRLSWYRCPTSSSAGATSLSGWP